VYKFSQGQIFANFANFAQIREIKSSQNAKFLSSRKVVHLRQHVNIEFTYLN